VVRKIEELVNQEKDQGGGGAEELLAVGTKKALWL